MGTIATIIAVFYTVVSVAAIVFMLFVVRSTRGRRHELVTDERALREREKTWFAIVVGLLVALLAATIFFTPYGRSAGKGAQIVEVKAQQFAWIIPSKPIVANRQVEFKLTSTDVNHSFAVYTMSGTLLFQVQVMPGKTSTYVWTFHKPGHYRVLCLEYCGVGHAAMENELTVTA